MAEKAFRSVSWRSVYFLAVWRLCARQINYPEHKEIIRELKRAVWQGGNSRKLLYLFSKLLSNATDTFVV